MDDRGFDAFVRRIANHSTRRGMLREGALAIVALALTQSDGVEAHHYGAHIALGGACRHTNQCLHHAPASHRGSGSREWVYCADNGFRYDGAFNCCRHRGGSCERDEHCCGTREFCRNRVCTYLR